MVISTSTGTQVLELEGRRELTYALWGALAGFVALLAVQAWAGSLRLGPTLELLGMMMALAAVVFVQSRERLTITPSGLSRQSILPIARLNWSLAWSEIRAVELRRDAKGALEATLRMKDGSTRPLSVTAWVLPGQAHLQRRLQQLRRERGGSTLFAFLDRSLAEETFQAAVAERPVYAALRERTSIELPSTPHTRGYAIEHNKTIVAVLVATFALAIYVFAELAVSRYQYSAAHTVWVSVAFGMFVFPLCVHLVRASGAPLLESIGVALFCAATVGAACHFLTLRLNAATSARGSEIRAYQLTEAGTLFHPANEHVVEMTLGYYRDCIRRQAGETISVPVIEGAIGFEQIDKRALLEALERTCQRRPTRAR